MKVKALSSIRQKFEDAFSIPVLETLFEEKISRSRGVGRDGTRVKAFQKILGQEAVLVRERALSSGYRFTRYKEKLVSKGPGKTPRVLSIPTIRDRLALRALCNFLSKVFADAAIRKPHSYIKKIREELQHATLDHVFLRVDIREYYDTIDQRLLQRAIRQRLRLAEPLDLIQKAIQTPTLSKIPVTKGVPQGLSISNILASIYLAKCDERMAKKWTYYRYVDDILILCKQEEVDQAYNELKRNLRRRKLKWHELDKGAGKSYIAPIGDGVEYLGFHIKESGVSVRDSSYRKMFSTIASVITEYRYRARRDKLIWRLNLKISGCRFEGKNYGWMFFFLQTDDLVQLSRLDAFVQRQLERYSLGDFANSVKRFIKAYHEIRFNLDHTSYIPNFDSYSPVQMKETIRLIRGEIKDLDAMNDEQIRELFFSSVGREVSELEKDLMEATS